MPDLLIELRSEEIPARMQARAGAHADHDLGRGGLALALSFRLTKCRRRTHIHGERSGGLHPRFVEAWSSPGCLH